MTPIYKLFLIGNLCPRKYSDVVEEYKFPTLERNEKYFGSNVGVYRLLITSVITWKTAEGMRNYWKVKDTSQITT
ncbi:hypothetical protein [Candidatus Acidianus copahuensis]|uniref:hypothetical protein n=1 Tax=Candidatus Acidianus copahuensis TaxID=1160895 RepID=UPI0012372BDA|nr:hypothetical protein [Candidatus Acidianus copahuensis]